MGKHITFFKKNHGKKKEGVFKGLSHPSQGPYPIPRGGDNLRNLYHKQKDTDNVFWGSAPEGGDSKVILSYEEP